MTTTAQRKAAKAAETQRDLTAAQRGRDAVGRLLDEWQVARATLRLIEEAEHPDIIDVHGRVWTWWKGDLYRHDGVLAWPLSLIRDPAFGLPRAGLADGNPNYASLCAICRRETPSQDVTQ